MFNTSMSNLGIGIEHKIDVKYVSQIWKYVYMYYTVKPALSDHSKNRQNKDLNDKW